LGKLKKHPLTTVCRNCENFPKLVNFYRKKFYLSRKLYGYEVRNFCKPPNVVAQLNHKLLDKISENKGWIFTEVEWNIVRQAFAKEFAENVFSKRSRYKSLTKLVEKNDKVNF
jgi:hypothetical protein